MHTRHLPAGHLPLNTYRLQLNADFTCADAIAILDYLGRLGVTDLYLSPVLQATPGSTHGYDVVDHTRIADAIGGIDGLRALSAAAHERGMGVIVDVVPNHMAVPTPVWLNRPMWSILKRGAQSPYAQWFDVEIDQPILMPILGARIGQVLANQELELVREVIPTEPERGEQWLLRYHDHVFPVAAGTESLPLAVLVERQHYRLAHWRVADEELNYRRFFDVGTLAGVRVEEPEVFAATHALLLDLYREGVIDGFRVDHPDGLADPRQYFRRLAAATDRAWIAAEKILEGDEDLPADWPIAGTTGYDTAWRLGALYVDHGGALQLGAIMRELTGDSVSDWDQLARTCKGLILDTSLAAELRRLSTLMWEICLDDTRLRDHTFRALNEALRELVIALPRYRAYIVADEPAGPESRALLRTAGEVAMQHLPPEHGDTLDVVVAMLLGEEVGSAGVDIADERRREVATRFQQVCGAVQAKGIEDTAFYRWTHLVSLCEVGGSPAHFAISPDEMHAFADRIGANWPATMTAGTTHDTKRGEDVRARIHVLSHRAPQWNALITQARALTAHYRPAGLDGRTENLLWQTLAGTWTEAGPISYERLEAYLQKAAREQKTWTFWTAVNTGAEAELNDFVAQLLADDKVRELFAGWVSDTAELVRLTILGMKAIQLTLPGVADTYQGSEVTRTSLVDPDNRRPVDFERLDQDLRNLDAGQGAPDLDREKLALTAAILRLRRECPDTFVSAQSGYQPLATTSGSVFAFARTHAGKARVLTVAKLRLEAGGQVVLPAGTWRDILTGHEIAGGMCDLDAVITNGAVAVLQPVAATD